MPGAWPYTPPISPDTSDDEELDPDSLRTLSTPVKVRRLPRSPPKHPAQSNDDRSIFDEVFASTMTTSNRDHLNDVNANDDVGTKDAVGAATSNSETYNGRSSRQNDVGSSHPAEPHKSQLPSPLFDGKYSKEEGPAGLYLDQEREAVALLSQISISRYPSPASSDSGSSYSIDLSAEVSPLEDPRYRVSDIGKEKRWKGPSAAQNPIRELPSAWEEKVKQAVKLGHGQFSHETMRRILPSKNASSIDGWLNDDAVNEYLRIVAKSYNESIGCDSTGPPACHSFGSFFMSSLKNRGPSKMSSWARRAKLEGQRLLETDLVFFPICEHSHWTLMVLFPKRRRVEYFNSMSGGAFQHTLRLQQFLEIQLGQSFNADEWYFEKDSTPCPQQDNIIDCGVFATLAAKYLSLGLDLTYSAADIPLQRKIMVGELVKGAFFGAPPLDAGF